MDTRTYDLAGRIFLEATGVSREQQESVVRRECGDDDALFDVVMQMLRFDLLDNLADPADQLPVHKAPTPHHDPIDTVDELGGYQLLESIGRGGMGVVYRARQKSLNRIVALKVIRSSLLPASCDLRRFRFEAEAASEIEHPAVVPIYEIGEEDGYQFFSMQLVEGVSLDEWASQSMRSLRERVLVAAKLAEGIHHAHQCGVIHRDLKPANVIIDEDASPHIIDFGIASRIDVDTNMTTTGQLLGTPNYIAPELLSRTKRRPTFAADIYGIGALLYELATNEQPFKSSSIIETLHRVTDSEPINPRTLNSDVDADLHAVISKCLEKLPEKRYGSAAELAADLRSWLDGIPVDARRVTQMQRMLKWARRRPVIVGLVVAVVAVATLGFAGTLWQWRAAVQANQDFVEAAMSARAAEAEAKQLALAEREAREQAQLRFVALCHREAERAYEASAIGAALAWTVEAIRSDRQSAGASPQSEIKLEPLDALNLERWAELQPELQAMWSFPSEVVTSVTTDEWLIAVTERDGTYLCPLNDDSTRTKEVHHFAEQLSAVELGQDGRSLVGGNQKGELVRLTLDELRWTRVQVSSQPIIAFSVQPDSANVICLLESGEIRRVDLDAGTTSEVLMRREHATDVLCSPTGATFAVVEPQSTTLWDARTLELRCNVPLSTLRPIIAFSPDGAHFLATSDQGSYAGIVDLYEVDNGDRVNRLECDGRLYGMCYLGDTLVTYDFAHTVRMWKSSSEETASQVLQHTSAVQAVAVSSHNRLLAASELNGVVHLYAADESLRKIYSLNFPERTSQIEFHPPTSSLFVTLGDTVSCWSTEVAGQTMTSISDTGDRFSLREWCDNSGLLVVTDDNLAQIVNSTDGTASSARLEHSDRILFAKVVDDEHVVTGDRSGKLRVWNRDDLRKPLRVFDLGQALIRCDTTPVAKVIAVQLSDGNLIILDIRDGSQPCPRISLEDRRDNVVSLSHTPGTRPLPPYLLTRRSGRRWSVESGELLGAFAEGGSVNAALFDRLSSEVIIGTSSGRLERRDAESGALLESIHVHQAPVYRLAWHPDSEAFASCSGDGTAAVWATRPHLTKLLTVSHNDRVRSVEFSRDGRLLLTSSFDGTVQLWDTKTGTRVGPPIDFGNRVHLAQFAPDGAAVFVNREPFKSHIYHLPKYRDNRRDTFRKAVALSARTTDATQTLTAMSRVTWVAAWEAAHPDRLIRIPDPQNTSNDN